MSREAEREFLSTDPEEVEAWLKGLYEAITGVTVRPGAAELQNVRWVAAAVVHERALENREIEKNFPSKAKGGDLDDLSDLFYGTERPKAKAAVCTVRFHISAPQAGAVIIPAGTRVTDAGKTMVWATQTDAMIPAGETWADERVVCQTPGAEANGWGMGRIDTMIDLYDYCQRVENITVSDGGEDAYTDQEYYELLRASMDAAAAGTYGGYVYAAKRVSKDIVDALPVVVGPAQIAMYLMMRDGKLAGEEMKAAVNASILESGRRIMTDHVAAADPELVNYDVAFTYYISSTATQSAAEIKAAVEKAVEEYVEWQHGKLGRDITPDELLRRLYKTGVKRVVLTAPEYTKLNSGEDDTVPQVARLGTVSVVNGGFEDE